MSKYYCKHCGGELTKVLMPVDSDWGVEYLMICMNDECGYYQRGWEWMKEKFHQMASYRYKLDTFHNIDGPLPVRTPDDYKGYIAQDSPQ
ncbi:MAG: hypothetical protein QG635_282 [Bacteroidota bacterium]|nr:hypothetical protein [Bacteroidota bacterium]